MMQRVSGYMLEVIFTLFSLNSYFLFLLFFSLAFSHLDLEMIMGTDRGWRRDEKLIFVLIFYFNLTIEQVKVGDGTG